MVEGLGLTPFPSGYRTGLKQTKDVEFLNDLANDPDVFPYINYVGEGPADLSGVLERSIALATEHGAIIFEIKSPIAACFHTMFRKEGRGKHAYLAARDAAEMMFTETSITELHTYTPFSNPTATPPRTFGFKEWFDGKDAAFFRLNVMDWATKAPNLVKYGQWFHENLERYKEEPLHDPDPANDRYAGLACACALRGQIMKGVGLYNMWAMTAGYHPARLLDENTIDTGDAVWRVRDGTPELLKCQ